MYLEHVANFHTIDLDVGLYFSKMNEAQAVFIFSELFKETKTKQNKKPNTEKKNREREQERVGKPQHALHFRKAWK